MISQGLIEQSIFNPKNLSKKRFNLYNKYIIQISDRQDALLMCLTVMKIMYKCERENVNYLYTERESIFFESKEVKNQLLSSFGQRGQIAVAVHVDGFPLKYLKNKQPCQCNHNILLNC